MFQEISPGYFVDLFIRRLSYNRFLLNYYIFSSVRFLNFSLSKAASCSRYTHCHSRKLLVIYCQSIVLHYYRAYQIISLLNLPNFPTTILYHSSFVISFSTVQSWSTWCESTMIFLCL